MPRCSDISGCGPGIPRPYDTPQEGTRSVRRTRDEVETAFVQSLFRIHGMIHRNRVDDYELWAREFQNAADQAMALSNK